MRKKILFLATEAQRTQRWDTLQAIGSGAGGYLGVQMLGGELGFGSHDLLMVEGF